MGVIAARASDDTGQQQGDAPAPRVTMEVRAGARGLDRRVVADGVGSRGGAGCVGRRGECVCREARRV